MTEEQQPAGDDERPADITAPAGAAQDSPDHPPAVTSPTRADVRHAARLAAIDQHVAAARQQADILVGRVRVLVRNGVDLRDPERLADLVNDQVIEAVDGATVSRCGCQGAQGPAALALLAELARLCAEATR